MDLILPVLQTTPGALIAFGLLIAVSVFIIPFFMESPTTPKAADRIICLTDWGLSVAATFIGLGILWIQIEYPSFFMRSWRYRFVIPGFFFAFAGFKYFGGARHWTRFRA